MRFSSDFCQCLSIFLWVVAVLSTIIVCWCLQPNRSIIAVSAATVYFFCLVYAVNDAAEEYITLVKLYKTTYTFVQSVIFKVEYFRTEIFNLKWYEWDVSCRKVYSILITYLNEPMKVDFVVVNINRALFCQV